MKFVCLEEEAFRSFLDTHPLKTFLQTPEIAKVKMRSGWQIHYVGVEEENRLVAASMLVSKKTHFGKCEFYAPRGLLLDYRNRALLTFFVTTLKSYIKKQGGYVLRIDPYLVLQERNSDGKIVEGGIDNRDIVETLLSLGFVPKTSCEQVKWMYVLDIAGRSKEDIMKNMKGNTRNTIRRTLKSGIALVELKRDELDQFYDIMVKTGKRKQFAIRDLTYFQNMYDIFYPRGEIKYLLAELDLNVYIQNIQKEIALEQEKRDSLSPAAYNDGKRKDCDIAIENLKKRITYAEEVKSRDGQVITLSGSMFVMVKPEIIYLSSGNYEQYLKFYSQYLIQWEMIQYGIEHGFTRYNFYGISGNFDKNDPYYGVYDFKKGFNGYVEELIGEYELPITTTYHIIKGLKKIKHK